MSDDDEHPTEEELDRDAKDLFGAKVIKFPSKKEDDDNTVESGILAWNKKYGTVYLNNIFKIIDESTPGRVRYRDKKHWQDGLAHEKVLVTNQDPNGNVKAKFELKTKLWLESNKHRLYREVIFDPKHEYNSNVWGPQIDFNEWRGFATKSVKGHCYKILRYFRVVLCNNDKKIYRWFMAWIAHMVQRPWEKPETAIAIQGEEEGTGKSFCPRILSTLLDGVDLDSSLYFKASNAKMITGDFSGHLERCLLLHAEECFKAESEREDSIIKDLVSEPRIGINAKFKDAKVARNYIRLIMTGNPPHIVKAGPYARRFLVLEISSKYQQNTGYFSGLNSQLNGGGYEALMYYLVHYPITKYDLRAAPKTAGLSRQKIYSDKETLFWSVQLTEGHLSFVGTSDGKYYDGEQEYHVIKYKIFNQYQRWMNKRVEKDKGTSVSFGMKFGQFFPMVRDGMVVKDNDGKVMKYLRAIKNGDLNYYILPSLKTCRYLFGIYLGQQIEWPENDEWIEKPYDNE